MGLRLVQNLWSSPLLTGDPGRAGNARIKAPRVCVATKSWGLGFCSGDMSRLRLWSLSQLPCKASIRSKGAIRFAFKPERSFVATRVRNLGRGAGKGRGPERLIPRLGGSHVWALYYFFGWSRLGIYKAEPSRIGEGGGGDPVFSVGRDLMGPPQGVCGVR